MHVFFFSVFLPLTELQQRVRCLEIFVEREIARVSAGERHGTVPVGFSPTRRLFLSFGVWPFLLGSFGWFFAVVSKSNPTSAFGLPCKQLFLSGTLCC